MLVRADPRREQTGPLVGMLSGWPGGVSTGRRSATDDCVDCVDCVFEKTDDFV